MTKSTGKRRHPTEAVMLEVAEDLVRGHPIKRVAAKWGISLSKTYHIRKTYLQMRFDFKGGRKPTDAF